MNEFYEGGIGSALKALGLMADDIGYALLRHRGRQPAQRLQPLDMGDGQHGTPYPEKNMNISAERLARMIREMDDEEGRPTRVNPDNASYGANNNLDRLATWGAPTFVDEGRSSGGLMVPTNPRG
jgi:hypothetical protein